MKAIEKGQIWESDKHGFVRFLYIAEEVQNDTVEYRPAGVPPLGVGGSALERQKETVEAFINRLARGEYECKVPADKEPVLKLSKHEDTGKKYLRTIKSKNQRGDDGKLLTIDVDVYCVLDAYGPMSAQLGHAAKKILCAGQRGKGGKIQDLREAITAIEREIEFETDNVKPEPEPQKPETKEPILPPPENTLPPFVQKGDRIYVGKFEGTSECHEFYEYTSVRGEGLRKQKTSFVACRFCGKLFADHSTDRATCPKLNSP